MIVTKGPMNITIPSISTIELLVRVHNSLIGVKTKLWFAIECSSCKQGSMVEVLLRFIYKSFLK